MVWGDCYWPVGLCAFTVVPWAPYCVAFRRVSSKAERA